MTSVIRGFLQTNLPLHQSVRLRHRRFNFKYLRPPCDAKALVEQVCRPVLPLKEPWPLHIDCMNSAKREKLELKKKEKYTPYEILLAKEVKNRLEHAKWIAFFHKNPTDELEFLDMQVFLRKQCSMKLYDYENKIILKALGGTEFDPALVLFQSETYFGIGEELKIVELVQNLKKLPKIVLIGGILEGRLLTRAQLEYYASLPDITTVRSRLVGVINQPAQILIKHLTHHQNKLVSQLKSYEEILKKQGGPSTLASKIEDPSSSPSSRISSSVSESKDSIAGSSTSSAATTATTSAATTAATSAATTAATSAASTAATSAATTAATSAATSTAASSIASDAQVSSSNSTSSTATSSDTKAASSDPSTSPGTSTTVSDTSSSSAESSSGTSSDAKSSSSDSTSGTEKSDKTVLLVKKSGDDPESSSSSSSESSSDSSDSDSDDEKEKK